MKYTLFFSYQSDTADEYKFIKEILDNQLKTSLLQNGIELIVNYGMRDTAGNPALLDTMLKKGEECDIFLADLTYVTHFTNCKGYEKYIPNPNVMLELGHALNFHGNNHTIFIQNADYGEEKDLPVDLKGFRFPISYKLTNKLQSKVKERLIKELSDAIIKVVKSVKREDKEKYLPFEKFEYSQLKSTQNQYEFIVTDYYNSIVTELKKILSLNRFVILSGKSKCGKSRIIKEFVSSKFSNQQQDDFFYCKLSQTTNGKLYEKIKILKKELYRDSYFIVDGCDDTVINELDEILSGTNHKLILISEKSEKLDKIKIDSKKYINEIIYAKAPEKTYNFTELHITDVEHILAILNNNPQYKPNKYHVDEECQNLLGYLSLFSKVGFDNNSKEEFSYLCSIFELNETQSRNRIQKLINDEFVSSYGGFIFIEDDAVANEYAKDMWMQNIGRKLSFDSLIDKCNLALWFFKRQIQIASDSDECSRFLKNIIKENLRDIKFVDTYQGEFIVYELAEKFPKETINSLEVLICKNEGYKFQRIGIPFRAIQIIIKKEGFFDRAIQLLLKLRCKNTNNSLNIENVVVNEFKQINYDYNKYVSVQSFKYIYNAGYLDIVKNVYSSIFNVGYKSLSEEQTQYLKDMFLFLISIRIEHKDWANYIIINNIHLSKHLKISR